MEFGLGNHVDDVQIAGLGNLGSFLFDIETGSRPDTVVMDPAGAGTLDLVRDAEKLKEAARKSGADEPLVVLYGEPDRFRNADTGRLAASRPADAVHVERGGGLRALIPTLRSP
jgi:hypothetical protein